MEVGNMFCKCLWIKNWKTNVKGLTTINDIFIVESKHVHFDLHCVVGWICGFYTNRQNGRFWLFNSIYNSVRQTNRSLNFHKILIERACATSRAVEGCQPHNLSTSQRMDAVQQQRRLRSQRHKQVGVSCHTNQSKISYCKETSRCSEQLVIIYLIITLKDNVWLVLSSCYVL